MTKGSGSGCAHVKLSVLPDGRNSDQKAQKGPGKKSGPEESVVEFWQNFAKSGRKGAEENFLKKFLILQ
jgi:hypothetical protein